MTWIFSLPHTIVTIQKYIVIMETFTFTEVSDAFDGWGWGDYDNDGDMDILSNGNDYDCGWSSNSLIFENISQ
jgi:hypothetical protein